MYIDSHAHLFDEDFRNDLDTVLQRASDAGVEKIIVPGTTLETSREAVELAERYPAVYACVGFHPHEALKATERELEEIERLSLHPRVVAIGEIGLDYHYDFSPRETQVVVFKRQIEIAHRRDLPIVVHTRESMREAIEMVTEYVANDPTWRTIRGEPNSLGGRGVFHCFTGTASEATTLLDAGFYVSYPGIVTFKNSPVSGTLREIGFRNILLETDSPYLAPVPFRGQRNEPANVVYVANRIAELFEVSPSEVAAAATHNTRSLFRLDTTP